MKLAEDLRKAGANVWVDQLNIGLGKLWDQEVEKALGEASYILFIATEKSTTSNNVLNEVYYALEENKEVIPVIAAKCHLPFRLKRLQHIDFTVDYKVAFNHLLKALNLDSNNGRNPSMVDNEKKVVSKEENSTESLNWNEFKKGINSERQEQWNIESNDQKKKLVK